MSNGRFHHDHSGAPISPEADAIEDEIESIVDRLDGLITEVIRRIAVYVEKGKRIGMIVGIIIAGFAVFALFRRMRKKNQRPSELQ
jgi:tetrahydromethanopterin S-methyltransferase subunit G